MNYIYIHNKLNIQKYIKISSVIISDKLKSDNSPVQVIGVVMEKTSRSTNITKYKLYIAEAHKITVS